MKARKVLVALAALLAIAGTAQAGLVEDGLDGVEAPDLPSAPDLDTSAATESGAQVASGAGAFAERLGAFLEHAVSATSAALSQVGAALAAGLAEGADGVATAAVGTGGALLGLVDALRDGLVWLFTQPAMQDPTARMAASAGVAGAASGAAGLGIWGYIKRIGPFAGAPLYSRIRKGNVLDNPIRERIFNFIQDNPGVHTSKIAERLDLGWGTTVHHLKHLERHDLVSKRKARNHTCYFENGGTYSPQEQEALAALKNDKARRIAEHVRRSPGLSQKEVAEDLSLSQSLVSWHVSKLEQAGLVGRERNGKRSELEPADDLRVVLGAAE